MPSIECDALQNFYNLYSQNPSVPALKNKLDDKIQQQNIDEVIVIYKESVDLIENEISLSGFDNALIDLFHKVFQELEALISLKGDDNRYEFIVVIPVADRPQHLRNCLQSIIDLCKCFSYGGIENNKYRKIKAVIADDTQDEKNIIKNKEIVEYYNDQGIEVIYFGLKNQLHQIDQLNDSNKQALINVLGKTNRLDFSHKGASRMRNIAYLKLNEMIEADKKQLFYFIDSDQEFRVKVDTEAGNKDLYIKNYFYDLNNVFSETEANILTGKVVGDPPVSPAVMAGNFIEDVICFLSHMAEVMPDSDCGFHNGKEQKVDDASYHDMADLFGFNIKNKAYQYKCNLTARHDNLKCFNEFSNELERFFYGEHPTRKTYYEYEDALSSVKSARTIYTGNYVFKPDGLKYFIPFAALKLRMAGPVLGRIIKAEISDKFVSANLPMLHKRTLDDTGQSEFRPGINNNNQLIDLSTEFERQYFGDVMLFSIEKLTELGFPGKMLPEDLVNNILLEIEEKMHQIYLQKHKQIINKLALLKTIFNNDKNWWNQLDGLELSRSNFEIFINNIEYNFSDDSRGYELINSEHHKKKRHTEILDAIMSYTIDRISWQDILAVH